MLMMRPIHERLTWDSVARRTFCMNTEAMNARFIWTDLETSGLDPKTDHILEIAVIVTDGSLNELRTYEAIIWHDSNTLEPTMDPFVHEMHSDSGLLHRIKKATKSYHSAQRDIVKMLYDIDVKPFDGTIAGSTVHFDKAFLAVHMPLLFTFFNHRVFDTSTLKAASKLWAPSYPVLKENEETKHQAMADIRYSLELAHQLKKAFFKPVEEEIQKQTAREEPMPTEVVVVSEEGRCSQAGCYFCRGSGDWTKCPNVQAADKVREKEKKEHGTA